MDCQVMNNGKKDVLVISADPGKILYCTFNNKKYSGTVICGYIYEVDGKKLDQPHEMIQDDFVEIYPTQELIDGVWYDFSGKTYDEIKAEVVKIRYPYDNQLALLINYQNNPDKYKDRYNEMQRWRDYASEIAKKYN